MQTGGSVCRRKVIMSGFRKVELSSFRPGGREEDEDGTADEPEGTGSVVRRTLREGGGGVDLRLVLLRHALEHVADLVGDAPLARRRRQDKGVPKPKGTDRTEKPHLRRGLHCAIYAEDIHLAGEEKTVEEKAPVSCLPEGNLRATGRSKIEKTLQVPEVQELVACLSDVAERPGFEPGRQVYPA